MSSEAALREYHIEHITDRGYTSTPFSFSGQKVDEIFPSFDGVMNTIREAPHNEAQFIIHAFATQVPGRPDDSRGYIDSRRVGRTNPFEPQRGPGTDNKDVLQFTPLTFDQVYDRYAHPPHGARRGTLPPVIIRELLKTCREVYNAGAKGLRPVADALGLGEMIFAPKRLEHDNVHLLRVVHYLGREALAREVSDAAELKRMLYVPLKADLHCDRSLLTATPLEDKPGLVGVPARFPQEGAPGTPLTSDELEWLGSRAMATRIDYRNGSLKVFAGAKLQLPYTPEELIKASGDIPLLFHGVINDNPEEDRHAVILFTNEHAGIRTFRVPPSHATGFDKMLEHARDREARYGRVA